MVMMNLNGKTLWRRSLTLQLTVPNAETPRSAKFLPENLPPPTCFFFLSLSLSLSLSLLRNYKQQTEFSSDLFVPEVGINLETPSLVKSPNSLMMMKLFLQDFFQSQKPQCCKISNALMMTKLFSCGFSFGHCKLHPQIALDIFLFLGCRMEEQQSISVALCLRIAPQDCCGIFTWIVIFEQSGIKHQFSITSYKSAKSQVLKSGL